MKFFLLALISLSSYAHSNELTEILEVYGQETKFDILKNAFETSQAPATTNDFESFTENTSSRKYICVMANEQKPEELSSITVAKFSKKIAGTPSNGPLFPGTSERFEEKVIVGQDHWLKDNKFYDVFKNYSTNNDFVVRVPKNTQNVYSDLGGEVSIFFRKGLNFISFKIQSISESNGPLFPESPGKVHYFGYCYSK